MSKHKKLQDVKQDIACEMGYDSWKQFKEEEAEKGSDLPELIHEYAIAYHKGICDKAKYNKPIKLSVKKITNE